MSARNRRKAEQEQGKQRRSRSALIYTLLNDKVSRIYNQRPITLKTRYSQNVYRNGYGVVSEACYRVFDVMPMVSTEFSEKIGLVIQNDFEESRQRLDEDLQKAYQMAEDAGINIESVGSTVMQEISAKVMTPQDEQYLQMLEKLDELAGIIHSLWMLNKVDSITKKSILMGWQKHLTRLAYDTRAICVETVRRIADQQKQAEKHAKNRQEIHQKRMEAHEKITANKPEESTTKKESTVESKEEMTKEEAKTATG